jgi:hypothetical protein
MLVSSIANSCPQTDRGLQDWRARSNGVSVGPATRSLAHSGEVEKVRANQHRQPARPWDSAFFPELLIGNGRNATGEDSSDVQLSPSGCRVVAGCHGERAIGSEGEDVVVLVGLTGLDIGKARLP